VRDISTIGLTLLTYSSGTRFKGVSTAGKKYKASFSVPGTRDLKHLGTFECMEAAALCYARYLGPERVAVQVEDASRQQLTCYEHCRWQNGRPPRTAANQRS
jgi:hypothetical protein